MANKDEQWPSRHEADCGQNYRRLWKHYYPLRSVTNCKCGKCAYNQLTVPNRMEINISKYLIEESHLCFGLKFLPWPCEWKAFFWESRKNVTYFVKLWQKLSPIKLEEKFENDFTTNFLHVKFYHTQEVDGPIRESSSLGLHSISPSQTLWLSNRKI